LDQAPFQQGKVKLLQRIAAGDKAAFSAIVKEYGQRVARFVFRMVGHEEDAHDITQEVFTKVWRSIASLDDLTRFESWLWRIAANTARDHLRRRRNQHEVPMSSLTNPEDEENPGYDIEDSSTTSVLDTMVENEKAGQEAGRFAAAWSKLTEEERAVWGLLRDRVPPDEIAEILGLSRGRQRVYEIKRRVLAILEEETRDKP
jgi:RNA polymerase sigma-70 factor (ECF subfamily)